MHIYGCVHYRNELFQFNFGNFLKKKVNHLKATDVLN